MSKDGSFAMETFRPRDRLGSGNGSKRGSKKGNRRAQEFFVPSFSVKRPVIPTDESTEFMRNLRDVLPKNYRVRAIGDMAMTILEMSTLIEKFHMINIQPDPEEIKATAESLQGGLKTSLYGVPRELHLPLGRVNTFGSDKRNRTSIGIEPKGWKGPSARYADIDLDKNKLPMPILVREFDIVAGRTLNSLSSHEGFTDGLVMNTANATPHITIAIKEKGGSISDSELSAVAGIIDEVKPPELELFDPVTHLLLESGVKNMQTLFARRPTGNYRNLYTR